MSVLIVSAVCGTEVPEIIIASSRLWRKRDSNKNGLALGTALCGSRDLGSSLPSSLRF